MKEVLSLEQAILATLVYFDLLDFAPTISELKRYLYGWSAPEEAIRAALSVMPEISHAHGYYFLKGRREIAELRKERAAIAKKLWGRVERYRFLFEICPYAKIVCVCNSLAYGNVDEKSDIDLFVIVRTGRLAIARAFLKLLTQIFSVRVHHEKIAGRFCLSFFVAENTMNLKRIAHDFDPHLAYFIKTIVPIFGSKDDYKRFLQLNNEWVRVYFKRALEDDLRLEKLHTNWLAEALRNIFEGILWIFGNLPEKLLYKFQLKRDEKHKARIKDDSGILMTKDIFKFHEKDPRQEIAEKFREKLELL